MFCFLIPDEVDDFDCINPDVQWDIFTNSSNAWSLLTYLRIKDIHPNHIGNYIIASKEIQADRINIGTPELIYYKSRRFKGNLKNTRFVSCLSDKRFDFGASISIVQNPIQAIRRPNSIYIPHWSQPGIIPRNNSKSSVKVGILGISKHSSSIIRNGFLSDCESLGLIPHFMDSSCWNDFSDIRVAVGVRSFSASRFIDKPATKLVNSWIAGVPFIGGNEVAFTSVGVSGLNYLVASDYQSLITSLKLLVENQELEDSIISNGIRAKELYTNSVLVERWLMELRVISNYFSLSEMKSLPGKKLKFLANIYANKVDMKVKNYFNF